MQHGTRSVSALAIGCAATLAITACQSTGPTPTDLEAIRRATQVMVAYERGDCRRVQELTEPEALATWGAGELRSSTSLLRAFCTELGGDFDSAWVEYQEIIDDAPDSFAAADALERMRLLDAKAEDPAFDEQMEAAARRASQATATRTPVDRIPAEYPPLAHAAGVEGFVVVEFGVTSAGETEDARVVDAEPPLVFDGAALRAVRQWLYLESRSEDAASRHAIRLVFRGGAPLVEPEPEAEARSSSATGT
ncbi:MAG: TonB family protein [Myxococcota bacterium]